MDIRRYDYVFRTIPPCATVQCCTQAFTKERHERFCRCPKCRGETKHQKLRDDDLKFGEVLDKVTGKQK